MYILLFLIFFTIPIVNSYGVTNYTKITKGGKHSYLSLSSDKRFLGFAAYGGEYEYECNQVFRLDTTDITDISKLSSGLGISSMPTFVPFTNYNIAFSSNVHKTKVGDLLKNGNVNTCPKHICESTNDLQIQNYCLKYGKDNLLSVYKDYDIFINNVYGNNVVQSTNTSYFIGEITYDRTGKNAAAVNINNKMLSINIVSVINDTTYKVNKVININNLAWGLKYSSDGSRIYFFHHDINDDLTKLSLSKDLFYTKTPSIISYIDLKNYQVKPLLAETDLYTSMSIGNNNDAFIVKNGTVKYLNLSNGIYETVKGFENQNVENVLVSDDYREIFVTIFNNTSKDSDIYVGSLQTSISKNVIYKNDDETFLVLKELSTGEIYNNITHYPGENHIKNVKQLTFGGENAEGYFSFDDKKMTYQATGLKNYGTKCDQIYQLDLTKDQKTHYAKKISTGLGVCTCSYFLNDNQTTLYAGTFGSVTLDASKPGDTCPDKVCQSPQATTDPVLKSLCSPQYYTWDIYPEFDIFIVNKYGKLVQQLTNTSGYDAEAVLSPDGSKIAFTSMRTGDLELFTMNVDGSDLRQITFDLGYDGGSFFSPDGKKLVFRASRPKSAADVELYKTLLKYNMVEPVAMELFVVNVDGTNLRQITHLGKSSWAPYYLNDNKRIIFSSDFNATEGFSSFDLYVINDDGTGLEHVTNDPYNFNAFPMMNYEGTKIVWGSSRNAPFPTSRDDATINLFLADWVDLPKSNNSSIKNYTLISCILAILYFFRYY
uniref:DPPIV_N domain-containing protein n=1 Tax=Parastrongyloides trichosuri TaxID=131310 RepID=A0A0N4ZSD5_PARTI